MKRLASSLLVVSSLALLAASPAGTAQVGALVVKFTAAAYDDEPLLHTACTWKLYVLLAARPERGWLVAAIPLTVVHVLAEASFHCRL